MKETNKVTTKNVHAVALGKKGGRKGGLARAESLSPERRSEIASMAAKTRWANKKGSVSPSTFEFFYHEPIKAHVARARLYGLTAYGKTQSEANERLIEMFGALVHLTYKTELEKR